ncbi:WG repeat-containing protein [Lysobacter sp.]|uniref:WG repeat-containing protein n=1 Tax=Lysobacter sp. TaxID=72226 RepID=UPI002D5150A8|nr:WG repeat-containing protein [Lysobacter sp.]HZX76614.1 WG repeat-containing protein [Lysobacter sp.]
MTNLLAGRRLSWALGFILVVAAVMLLLCLPFATSRATGVTRAQTPQVFGVCLQGVCGVLDSHGKVVRAFDSKYRSLFATGEGDLLLARSERTWSLVTAGGETRLPVIGDQLYPLKNGLFAFSRDEKMGLLDAGAREIQPPRFDMVEPFRNGAALAYYVGDRMGVLDVKGNQVTGAVYSYVVSDGNSPRWIMAQRDRPWLIDLEQRTERPAEFHTILDEADGIILVKDGDHARGLIDANGKWLVEPRYDWVKLPSSGRIAFDDDESDLCGYLDGDGKELIPAQFAECQPFGTRGAFVVPANAEEYWLIDRAGNLQDVAYDKVHEAGLFDQRYGGRFPDLASVGRLDQDGHNVVFGLFDLKAGRELLAPKYGDIAAIGADLFRFYPANEQYWAYYRGDTNRAPPEGLLDRSGKVLIEPSEFSGFRLDESGRFVLARKEDPDQARRDSTALFDLQGRQLVAAYWHVLEVDLRRGLILAYDLHAEGRSGKTLRAVFDLQGEPRFMVRPDLCYADELVDAQGVRIWPPKGESDPCHRSIRYPLPESAPRSKASLPGTAG